MSKKENGRKIGRDAETGQFIPVEEAKKNRGTAIVETLPAQNKSTGNSTTKSTGKKSK